MERVCLIGGGGWLGNYGVISDLKLPSNISSDWFDDSSMNTDSGMYHLSKRHQ